MDEWNLLDEDSRKISSLEAEDVKVANGKIEFKRPDDLWFYQDQEILLFRETIEKLQSISISVDHIFQDEAGNLRVKCSIEDLQETQNRRSEYREFIELETLVETSKAKEFGTVIDLSNGGAKVELSKGIDIRVGSVLTLDFFLDGKRMSRRGSIQWVLLREDCVYVGLKFFK